MQCAAGEIRGKEPGDAGSELKSRRRRTTMDNRMFCFQCEQTAGCAGCTGKAGVCGKTAEVAELQDQLTAALVGLSRAVDNAPDANEGTWRLIIEGLFTTVTNVFGIGIPGLCPLLIHQSCQHHPGELRYPQL